VIRNSTDLAVQTMLEAMYQAYEHDPIKRPTAPSIAAFLKGRLDKIRADIKPATHSTKKETVSSS